MKRWYGVVLVSLAAVGVAIPGSAQNLLSNGSFDTDVSGWDYTENLAVWRGDTGNTLAGGSGPGCAELRQEGDDCNGAIAMIVQRVPVTPGKAMLARVAAYVPGGDNSAQGAGASVNWLDASNNTIATSWLVPTSTQRDEWFWLEIMQIVPEGAAQAELGFGVHMPGGGCSTPAVAIFDDAWLATIAPDVYVPAAAAGKAGTYWSTTLWAYNPNTTDVHLEGAFLAAKQDNSAAVGSPMALGTVPAGGTLEVADVVSALGASGTGGLYLRAEDASNGQSPPEGLQVVTYTFTPNPAGGGNYGQGIPAESAGGSDPVRCPGVRHDGAYRTNVGVLNTSAEAITVRVEIRGVDGTVAGSGSWELPPYAQRQESVQSLGVSSLAQGVAVISLESGPGPFRGYISRVDNTTGDAVYVLGR